jgi:PAS domain S-box-containing protein
MDEYDPAGRRAAAVARYRILDKPREPIYDGFARIAARSLDTPIVGIAIADGNRLWFKGSLGLDVAEIPLDSSLCAPVVVNCTPHVSPDTRLDPVGRAHPLIAGPPYIRFHASVPLVNPEGIGVGVLFVADTVPRPGVTTADLRSLEDIAIVVMAALEARVLRFATEDALAQVALTNRLLSAASSAPSVPEALRDTMTVMNESVGGCACLVWYLPKTIDLFRQVAAIATGRVADSDFLAQTSVGSFTSEGTIAGRALRSGQQIITPALSEMDPNRMALRELSLRYGIVSQITTPMRIAGEAYVLVVCFDRTDIDLNLAAARINHAVAAFLPAVSHALAAERSNLFRRCVEASSASVVVTEANALDEPGPRMIYVNPAFETVTGYRVAEMLGRSPRMLQGAHTEPAARATIRAALTAGQPVRERLTNYRADGTPYTIELNIAPLHDAAGHITHFFAIERDITEQLRADEMRRYEAGVLSDAMRLARLGTWRVNLANDTVDWSDDLYAIFGLIRADGQLTRAEIGARIHPDDFARTREWLGALTETTDLQRMEHRLIRPDGRIVHCWLEGRRRTDPVTGDAVLEGICQDVTERREAEQALLHAEKLRTIGQMTGGIAHDFNNLLTVIAVSLDLAATKAAGDAEMLALVRAALDATEKGARLTAQLLAYSRRQRLSPRRVLPGVFAADIAAVATRTLGARYAVDTAMDAHAEPFLADPVHLESAVVNLLVNARDAQPDGGALHLRIAPMRIAAPAAPDDNAPAPGRYTALTVIDHGCGMDEATASRAFEPFFTTKPVGKGTGLGLSMVMGFIRQSGGHVSIDTAPGRGTAVTIALPVATEPAEAGQPGAGPAALVDVEVLLVETDDALRAATGQLCAGYGMVITAVASAQEALDYLRAGITFGLLITGTEPGDGMTGSSLGIVAQAVQPGLRVLLVSPTGADTGSGVFATANPDSEAAFRVALERALGGGSN